jgi:hypothetical protein
MSVSDEALLLVSEVPPEALPAVRLESVDVMEVSLFAKAEVSALVKP